MYWFVADGVGPLLDPDAMDVVMTADGPRSVVRSGWPKQPSLGSHHHDPIVYELHVRGFGRTFAGCVEHLPYLADLGVNVIELMPVHPFDTVRQLLGIHAVGVGRGPPAVCGRRRCPRASLRPWSPQPTGTTSRYGSMLSSITLQKPTRPSRRCRLRGFDDANAYLHRADGSYNDDSGTGNVSNPGRPQHPALDPHRARPVRRSRDRRLSFRPRLAADPRWRRAGRPDHASGVLDRDVRLIAEPWDLAAYQVGQWKDPWLQWNDRFRDDVRGFVRGEPGLVSAVIERLQGSPDLFPAGSASSVNFLTAHDGLTMHDLTTLTSDHHHSWDCGDALRLQQLKNYFTMLLLSAGTPMFVMGDEFARTQGGLDNPYNIDSEVTWVDWNRLDAWAELHDFVRALVATAALSSAR